MAHHNDSGNERMNGSSSSHTPDWKAKSELAEGIINAAIDSLVAVDPELKIMTWNDVAGAWSGLRADEVLGKRFFDVFPDAAHTPGLGQALREALKGRKTFLPSGPEFYLPGYFETHFIPLKNPSGEIIGVLQVIHDVAHRVKAENELRELNNRLLIQNTALQHAQEEMATFAKIAAHDLKEPLRKIYSFTELIKVQEAHQLSDRGRSHFRTIQKSVQRMGLLTDDIVNFLSLDTGREKLEKVDLSATLAEATATLKDIIEQTGARIRNEALPIVTGYPDALGQLFRQVLDNALKFRRREAPPEITIRCDKLCGNDISCPEARQDAYYYRFSFEDNGIGFEPQYSTRIFGLFQRLHPQGIYRGSGMGLALALKAARMHDGFMTAESVPDQGSRFYCFLPLKKPRTFIYDPGHDQNE